MGKLDQDLAGLRDSPRPVTNIARCQVLSRLANRRRGALVQQLDQLHRSCRQDPAFQVTLLRSLPHSLSPKDLSAGMKRSGESTPVLIADLKPTPGHIPEEAAP